MGIPAISLWQPWASLIVVGAKTCETRHWRPPGHVIGGRIAIHAAKHRIINSLVDNEDFANALRPRHGPRWAVALPLGAFVCTATLAAAHRVDALNFGDVCLSDGTILREDGFGDYTEGRYCWMLTDVVPIDPPIPAKGRQGFWTCTL